MPSSQADRSQEVIHQTQAAPNARLGDWKTLGERETAYLKVERSRLEFEGVPVYPWRERNRVVSKSSGRTLREGGEHRGLDVLPTGAHQLSRKALETWEPPKSLAAGTRTGEPRARSIQAIVWAEDWGSERPPVKAYRVVVQGREWILDGVSGEVLSSRDLRVHERGGFASGI